MIVGIGADHRGYKLKSSIRKYLEKHGHQIIDYGTHTPEVVDYPEIALRLAQDVSKKKVRYGILICYTGQGMAMAANKVKGIRAAICTTPRAARLTRQHNDANVLVLPAGFVKFDRSTQQIIRVFLNTKFEGGRHRRRINLITAYEDTTGRV